MKVFFVFLSLCISIFTNHNVLAGAYYRTTNDPIVNNGSDNGFVNYVHLGTGTSSYNGLSANNILSAKIGGAANDNSVRIALNGFFLNSSMNSKNEASYLLSDNNSRSLSTKAYGVNMELGFHLLHGIIGFGAISTNETMTSGSHRATRQDHNTTGFYGVGSELMLGRSFSVAYNYLTTMRDVNNLSGGSYRPSWHTLSVGYYF